MKITVEQADLKAALALLRPIVNKPTLDNLNGVKIEAGKTISLTCSDLDVTGITDVDGNIDEKGTAIPSVHTLSRVVNVLPAGPVQLELVDGNLRVTHGDTESVVRCYPDFPRLLSFDGEDRVELTASDCRKMLHVCAAADTAATAAGERRSVHFEPRPDGSTVVATDGYRLVALDVEPTLPEALVPAEFLARVLASVDDDGVTIEATRNDVQFTTRRATWRTRQTSGQFPDRWPQLIPAKPTHEVTVSRDDMLAGLRVVSATIGDDSTVRIHQDGGKLLVSTQRQDVGNTSTVVQCQGDLPADIGVNLGYFTTMLAACDDDEVTLRLVDELKPLVVRSAGLTLLLMPVRLG